MMAPVQPVSAPNPVRDYRRADFGRLTPQDVDRVLDKANDNGRSGEAPPNPVDDMEYVSGR